jgi:hypothetical protein
MKKAGPGQMPDIPHPTSKEAAPKINLKSIAEFAGILNLDSFTTNGQSKQDHLVVEEAPARKELVELSQLTITPPAITTASRVEDSFEDSDEVKETKAL